MVAYAWRSGRIEFGEQVPGGALPIASGDEEALRPTVEALARWAYDNTTLLVPGLPEAECEADAYDAMLGFRDRVIARLREASNG